MPAIWVGDNVCDDGINSPGNLMCEEFNWDNGDCGIESCGDGLVMDCNGNCVSVSLIGDGFCNNNQLVNFACDAFGWDGGDCEPECGEGQFMDCNGNCWDDAVLGNLSNGHCNNTFWPNDLTDLNLDCEMFNFDGGDCIVWACTDPTALNYYEHATQDDGTCFYGDCPPGTMDCMGNCIPENWIGNNECVGGMSDNPEGHLFNGAYPDQLSTNVTLPANQPRGMCVLPDGSKAFIGTTQGIVVADLNNLGECSSSSLIAAGGLIYSCSSSADGLYVFAANWDLGQVEVVDVASETIIQS
ncbi:MAG: hypothetical protein HKN32_09840, partial [Flavobacteriales bacterium]|nr:hypothetical protein [Flavobacteriales bacterium]